jgi:hypothetical protein
MRRREVIGFAGTALFAWPPVARAQPQAKIARLGYLGFGIPAASANRVEALRAGLRDLGYVEGKNSAVIYRRQPRQVSGEGDALRPPFEALTRTSSLVFVVGGLVSRKLGLRTHRGPVTVERMKPEHPPRQQRPPTSKGSLKPDREDVADQIARRIGDELREHEDLSDGQCRVLTSDLMRALWPFIVRLMPPEHGQPQLYDPRAIRWLFDALVQPKATGRGSNRLPVGELARRYNPQGWPDTKTHWAADTAEYLIHHWWRLPIHDQNHAPLYPCPKVEILERLGGRRDRRGRRLHCDPRQLAYVLIGARYGIDRETVYAYVVRHAPRLK